MVHTFSELDLIDDSVVEKECKVLGCGFKTVSKAELDDHEQAHKAELNA